MGAHLYRFLHERRLDQSWRLAACFALILSSRLASRLREKDRSRARFLSSIANEPTVGVVDGGCTARRYEAAIAWRDAPFVGNGLAATRHGNQVVSVVVHGHEWNNNLPLPELYCRIGVAQAIARSDAGVPPDSLGAYFLPRQSNDEASRNPSTEFLVERTICGGSNLR